MSKKSSRALDRVRLPLSRYNRGGGPHATEKEELVTALKEALISEGLTYRRLSELTGVSVGQISGVLSGEKKGTIDLLITLAQQLRVSYEFSSAQYSRSLSR